MALPTIVIQAGIGLGLWALNKYVLPGEPGLPPPTKPPPKPLKLPRTGIGTMMPLVYGDVRIDTPVLLWTGSHVIYTDGLGVTSRSIDLLLGLGIPMSDVHSDWRTLETPPRLMAVWVNGVRTVLGAGGVGITHGARWSVSVDLGGRGSGGTFVADIEFFDGRPDQIVTGGTGFAAAMQNANLGIPIDTTLVPGYAHQMCAAVLTSPGAIGTGTGSVGEATNLVSIGFEVRAYGADAILVDGTTYEANPAMVLYDLICGRVWKLGYSTALVDVASFNAVASTLATEAHGMSGIFATDGSATALIVAILDQINGMIYEDQATGKLKLRIIRSDYNSATIHELTPDNTLGEPQVAFVGWSDLLNEVRIGFTDRSINHVRNEAVAQRGAIAVGQSNRIRSHTIEYPAVTSQTLAATLAARELGVASKPLLTAVAKVTRAFYSVSHGDAVKASWPGIVEGKVFRVVDIDHGLLENGAITLTLIEDVFQSTTGSYTPWTPPWGNSPPFEIAGIRSTS